MKNTNVLSSSYNDQVHDLQDTLPAVSATDILPPARKNLKVKVQNDRVVVEGLRETKITSLAEGLMLLDRGRENRSTDDNNINHSSSRSHTVFIVRVGNSKLHIVDLAGSERSKRTKATGVRQAEASSINLSLTQLMLCLDAMRTNQKLARLYPDKPKDKPPFRNIPFRDCKLTMLFRDCLKGKNCGGVVMIVNASSNPTDFEETNQALRYGEMTKSTAIESNSSNNLINLAAAAGAGKRYDYNGRVIREQAQNGGVIGVKPIIEEKPVIVTEIFKEITNKEPEPRKSVSSPVIVQQNKAHIPSFASPVVVLPSKAPVPVTPAVVSFDEETESLRRELAEARGRLVTLEMEIREELTKEMNQRIQELQERYLPQINRTQDLMKESEEHLLRSRKKMSQQASGVTIEDLKILADQVKECEDEMDRMREIHAREVEALQAELNKEKRANIETIQNHRPLNSTPWMVAEERKRVNKLAKELDDEKEAHRQVILERAELQDALDTALRDIQSYQEREKLLLNENQFLKDDLEAIRTRYVEDKENTSRGKHGNINSPRPFEQLLGKNPNSLLKRRNEYLVNN